MEIPNMPRQIHVSYDHPPIPVRQYDYAATFDDYEPGCPIGRGETPEAAVRDLLEQAGDE
jgi:hypothetical protein